MTIFVARRPRMCQPVSLLGRRLLDKLGEGWMLIGGAGKSKQGGRWCALPEENRPSWRLL
jgi:hypothetical protein